MNKNKHQFGIDFDQIFATIIDLIASKVPLSIAERYILKKAQLDVEQLS